MKTIMWTLLLLRLMPRHYCVQVCSSPSFRIRLNDFITILTIVLGLGELRAGTDESTFNAVICQRSYPQLQAVMQEYQRITGHSLQKAVKHEFSGDIEEGLLTICKC